MRKKSKVLSTAAQVCVCARALARVWCVWCVWVCTGAKSLHAHAHKCGQQVMSVRADKVFVSATDFPLLHCIETLQLKAQPEIP
jgi:hypothetical protein